MSAWGLGMVAVILNIIVLVQGFKKFFELETNRGRTNKALILVISFGDLLQGLFLLCAAVGDTFFNKSTCQSQFEWLTKPFCPLLGILSTIGSLISLYSMSLLSLIRLKGILSAQVSQKTDLERKYLGKLATATFLISVLASFIATLPVFSTLEDFFVRNVVYENNKYFVGSINKEANLKILQGYYGRFRSAAEGEEMEWEKLRFLVQDMYNDTSPTVKSLSFYATSGICLFNYFVRTDNPQIWYIGAVQISNLICVIVIAICYLWINIVTLKSSEAAGRENVNAELEPTDPSKQPIRTRYLGHVTGYQPIGDQNFAVPAQGVIVPAEIEMREIRRD
eukprot:sb/3466506/